MIVYWQRLKERAIKWWVRQRGRLRVDLDEAALVVITTMVEPALRLHFRERFCVFRLTLLPDIALPPDGIEQRYVVAVSVSFLDRVKVETVTVECTLRRGQDYRCEPVGVTIGGATY